jgi:hypothetical protein
MAERTRIVQPAHEPGTGEHDDAVVVPGAYPAAHALLDALQLAGGHRDGVIQRGCLDAVDAAVGLREPVDDQDTARVVGQVDPVVLADQDDQAVRVALESFDAVAHVARVQLVVGHIAPELGAASRGDDYDHVVGAGQDGDVLPDVLVGPVGPDLLRR